MADIVVTAAKVALVDQEDAKVKTYIAAVAITAGQAVYLTSAGTINLADANGSGTLQFRGIAITGGAAGQPIDVCEDGELEGFTLAGAYDSLAYLSNTAGALADAAGGSSIICGRVTCRPKPDYPKTLRVFANPIANYS